MNIGSLDDGLAIVVYCNHIWLALESVSICCCSASCCQRSPSCFIAHILHIWKEQCTFKLSNLVREPLRLFMRRLYHVYFNTFQSGLLSGQFNYHAETELATLGMLLKSLEISNIESPGPGVWADNQQSPKCIETFGKVNPGRCLCWVVVLRLTKVILYNYL